MCFSHFWGTLAFKGTGLFRVSSQLRGTFSVSVFLGYLVNKGGPYSSAFLVNQEVPSVFQSIKEDLVNQGNLTLLRFSSNKGYLACFKGHYHRHKSSLTTGNNIQFSTLALYFLIRGGARETTIVSISATP